jgi:diguanylate cyclase (GGDEF)-like protein/PAS domain S-box-containing protein
MAWVSLIDTNRQWIKSSVGSELKETPREIAFCAHAIEQQGLLIVPDARADERFAANPLVTGAPHIRFYAGAPLITPDGHALGTVCVLDRTPRTLRVEQTEVLLALAEEAMAQLELRNDNHRPQLSLNCLQIITDSVPALISYVDTEERFRFNNAACEEWFGCSREDLYGRHLRDELGEAAYRAIAPQVARALCGYRGSFEVQQVHYRLGEPRHLSVTYIPDLGVGLEVKGFVAFMNDITERKRTEERLSRLANYDALTDLPNRLLSIDRLAQALNQAARRKRMVAVLYLDLDGFKSINDTFGHDIGDVLLKAFAARLMGCVRESDTVGRLGGDEFVVILSDVAQASDAAHIVEKLANALRGSFRVGGHDLFVTASIGISLYPEDGEDAKTLLKNADTAMYHAKGRGRYHYQFYFR